MSDINVTISAIDASPDDIIRVLRLFMRSARKRRALQAKTARKAWERRQWHKVARR